MSATPTKSVKTKLVARYLEAGSSEYSYILSYWQGGKRLNFDSTAFVEEAMDFSHLSKSSLIEIWEDFQWKCGSNGAHCEIVKITIEIRAESHFADDPEFKELRQYKALSRLSNEEIELVGATSLYVYLKTKYHNP